MKEVMQIDCNVILRSLPYMKQIGVRVYRNNILKNTDFSCYNNDFLGFKRRKKCGA